MCFYRAAWNADAV